MLEVTTQFSPNSGYDQLLRMLSMRGLGWLRQQIEALPDPLGPSDPGLGLLAAAGQIAPILSGLRGQPSPLEAIVGRRLTPALVLDAAAHSFGPNRPAYLPTLLIAGRSMAEDEPLWQLACSHLAADATCDLADRLALGASKPELLTAAQDLLAASIPDEALGEQRIGRFARLLMQLYGHGATRPPFSDSRLFGTVFAHCLRYADWGRRNGSLVVVAQMGFCLRLIDPDHDVGDLLAEIIPYQRPDGSFPPRSSYSTAEQDWQSGLASTLMAVAMLNLHSYRRWQRPAPAPLAGRPFHASRDRAAQLVAERVSLHLSSLPRVSLLHAAASLSQATGENWFHRTGLDGYRPPPHQIAPLAQRVCGSFAAARFARATLSLPDRQHMPSAPDQPHLALALDWLWGNPVAISRDVPAPLLNAWRDAARQNDDAAFLNCCEASFGHSLPNGTEAIHDMARRIAHADLLAFAQDADDSPIEAILQRLDQLCLMSQIFEPQVWLAEAA